MSHSSSRHFLFFICFISSCIFARGQDLENKANRDSAILVNAGDLKWTDGPGGIKSALILGDPSKKGPFVERILFPANWKLLPHYHPHIEMVTVLSGSLYEGIGATNRDTEAKKIDAGGFIFMPMQTTHYVFTKEECMVQVQGYGPTSRTFVTSNDK